MPNEERSTKPEGPYQRYYKATPKRMTMTIRNMSRSVRNSFAAACQLRGQTMNEVVQEMMRMYARGELEVRIK